MGLGCHSRTATFASLQPRWHRADLGDVTGDLPLLTVPCEMRSGSSSRGLRGPLPFVRGHFGTARRHRPSLRLHIPDMGPFLRSLCHLAGPAPTTRRVSERSRAGRRRPAQPAAEGTHTGNAKVLLEKQRPARVANRDTTGREAAPRYPGHTAPQAAAPQQQLPPPRDSAFSPSAVPSLPGKCDVPGIPGVDRVLISTLCERTREVE